ncbi:hypothetical protein B7494_g3854 [Chlorociboria aeruginascens]|nr:hypothetical protein B7494_g3854 [Chlorociboria aeruginascens]
MAMAEPAVLMIAALVVTDAGVLLELGPTGVAVAEPPDPPAGVVPFPEDPVEPPVGLPLLPVPEGEPTLIGGGTMVFDEAVAGQKVVVKVRVLVTVPEIMTEEYVEVIVEEDEAGNEVDAAVLAVAVGVQPGTVVVLPL